MAPLHARDEPLHLAHHPPGHTLGRTGEPTLPTSQGAKFLPKFRNEAELANLVRGEYASRVIGSEQWKYSNIYKYKYKYLNI